MKKRIITIKPLYSIKDNKDIDKFMLKWYSALVIPGNYIKIPWYVKLEWKIKFWWSNLLKKVLKE